MDVVVAESGWSGEQAAWRWCVIWYVVVCRKICGGEWIQKLCVRWCGVIIDVGVGRGMRKESMEGVHLHNSICSTPRTNFLFLFFSLSIFF